MEKRRINVRAIVWYDGKLLAVKHKKKDGTASSYWATPGGGLDPFESLTDGLLRELMEETGVTAVIGNLLFINQFPSDRAGRDEELDFFYHVKNGKDFIDIDLAKTTHGEKELYCIEFVNPKEEHILPAFLQTVDIEKTIAEARPVFLSSDELPRGGLSME